MTDAEGKFVLGTNAPGDGVMSGLSKVAVIYVGPPSTAEPGKESPTDKVPPPKVKIPAKFGNADKSGVTVEVPAGGSTDLKIDLKD